MTSSFFEKLLTRLDRIPPQEMHGFLIRLVQEKGFFEQVFQALEEGIVICDPKGTISFINRAAAKFFGAEPETSPGRPVGEIIRGIDWAVLSANPGASLTRDLEVVYPEKRYLNFYLAPIRNGPPIEEGSSTPTTEIIGYALLLRDITQTREMTAQMLESARLGTLTMLAAGVAHEIGNPLNSLNIHLQLLERKLKKSHAAAHAAVSKQLEVTRSEVQRLHLIIEQFLGAMRPSKPVLEHTDLNQLIRESVSFLGPEIQDRSVKVLLRLAPELPLLRLDANQIKQACYNLIRNACQAMSQDGQLVIHTSLDDYEVRLTFADNGSGIGPETLGQLFEPYFTTKSNGTGLGLMVVQRIIRDHGGHVSVESEEGAGTRVSLLLPRGARNVRMLGDGKPESEGEAEPGVIDV